MRVSPLNIKKNLNLLFIRKMNYSPLPPPQGPLQTGCADLMIGKTTYGVLMRIYYPTCMKTNEKHLEDWTKWFLGYEYTKGLAKFVFPKMPFLFEMMFNWQTKSPKIPSLWEAPLSKGKFPLVIFSHGLSANRDMYSTICNDLASYGFFVAALEHRDNSACATFTLLENGEKEWHYYETLPKNVKEYPLRNKQVKLRAEECSRTLDIFERLHKGEHLVNELPSSFDINLLHDRIDISQPIIAGHSFGGSTVFLTLSNDKRFKFGIPLDPWMFPLKDDLKELKKSISQPMLIILTETFQKDPNFKGFRQIETDLSLFITLKGSVHQNQSDMPFLFGFIGKALGGCLSEIDAHLAMSLNNELMVNFISKHLGLKHFNESIDIISAAQHFQIGLDLRAATVEETDDLLRFSLDDDIQDNLLAKVNVHTAARL